MGRVAVVTGAARGIGYEVARQLGDAGYRVVVTARDGVRAAEAAEKLAGEGLDAAGRPLDVADPAGVAAFVDALAGEVDAVDVLVSNAAGPAAWDERPSSADLDAVRSAMEVTLYGTWRVTQGLLPLLRQSEAGRVVVVSSGAGSHADPAFGLSGRGGSAAGYGVAKAGLNALVALFAAELDDVAVNAVCPGLTATFEGAEAMGARPVAEAAATIVWAAATDIGSGGFYRDGKRLGW